MEIQHFLQSFHAWMSSQDAMMFVIPICGMVWVIVFLWRFVIPTLKATKDSVKTSEAMLKEIEALIDQAVKRAPPVEAKPEEEGAPFEEYRKDLWRMTEGEISIDEFVDIWRGRKVQKRPAPERKLTPEEIEQVKKSDTFQTVNTLISEFSKGLEKIVEFKKAEALNPEQTWEEHAYRIDEIQKDLGTEPGSAFLVLWAQYLKSSDPGKLADFFAAWLKGEANADSQVFAGKFLLFIKNREWDQVLTVIEPRLQSKELFQSAYAEIFFIGFRDGVLRRCEQGIHGIPGGMGSHGSDGQDGLGSLQGAPAFYEGFRDMIIEEIKKGKETPELVTGIGWPKQPKYNTGKYVRVKRPTSPAFEKIGRIQSIHDNGIEWEYILEVQDICGKGYVIGLAEEECEIAVPKVGEWWRWLKNDACKSVFKPVSYEPYLWQIPRPDSSILECCKDGCLMPVNFGRGE